jgi:hypothetical protein
MDGKEDISCNTAQLRHAIFILERWKAWGLILL